MLFKWRMSRIWQPHELNSYVENKKPFKTYGTLFWEYYVQHQLVILLENDIEKQLELFV